MSEKRAFADVVAAACNNAAKQIQPPVEFHDKPADHRRNAEYLRAQILSAKRYILDDDVVHAAVDLGTQHPEIVLAVLKNALAPFDNMWIEWDCRAQRDAAINNHPGSEEVYNNTTGPLSDKVGVLLKRVGDTGYRITMVGQCMLETSVNDGTVAAGKTGMRYSASPMAIYYDIHSPVYGGQLSYAEQIVDRYTDWTPQLIRAALLAGAYANPNWAEAYPELADEGLDEQQMQIRLSEMAITRMQQCDTLASHAQWTFDPNFGKVFRDRVAAGPDPLGKDIPRSYYYRHAVDTLGLQIREEAGMFRFVVSVIALMIARDRLAAETIVVREKGASKFVGGKLVPFLENRRVTMMVPRKIANKKILRSLAKSMPRALHDVEGHWKQRRQGYDANCEHVMVWETPRREVCAIEGCGFKRWRVDEFKRGDASIGVIKKTHVAELDRKVKPIPALANET